MSLIGKWTSGKCGKGDILLRFTGKGKIIHYPVIYAKKDLGDMEINLENSGNLLMLFPINTNIISPNIYFQQSEYKILRSSYPELNSLWEVLKEDINLKIKIEGHTDQIGNGKYNLILSEQRALEIKKYLVERGIGNERIKIFGYGDTFPRCPPPCKKNRRIEYMIY